MGCEARWLWVPVLPLPLHCWEALVFSSLKWADGNGNLLCDSGSSNLVLCDNLVGWDGVGVGSGVQEEGDICVPMADSFLCMTETNTILQSNFSPVK